MHDLHLVDEISDFFNGIENKLFSAINGGDTALREFAHTLSAQKAVVSSSRLDYDASTRARAYTAATSVSVIAESFHELESKWEREQLNAVDQLLQSLSLSDLQSGPPAKATSPFERYIQPTHSLAPHFAASSKWLLENLANPYPSPSDKRTLTQRTGCSPKTLTDWFAHARAKIGWTKIVKRHFGGQRPRAVDSAYRVLYGAHNASANANAQQRQPEAVVRDFEAMRRAAEVLCGVDEQPLPSLPPLPLPEVLVEKLVGAKPDSDSSLSASASARSRKRSRSGEEEGEPATSHEPAVDDEERPTKRTRGDGSVQRTRRVPRDHRPYTVVPISSSPRQLSPYSYDSAESSSGPSTPATSPGEAHVELFVEVTDGGIETSSLNLPDTIAQQVLLFSDGSANRKTAKRPRQETTKEQQAGDSHAARRTKRPRCEEHKEQGSEKRVSLCPSSLESTPEVQVASSLDSQLFLPPSHNEQISNAASGAVDPTQLTFDDIFSLDFNLPPPTVWSDTFLADSIFEPVCWTDSGFIPALQDLSFPSPSEVHPIDSCSVTPTPQTQGADQLGLQTLPLSPSVTLSRSQSQPTIDTTALLDLSPSGDFTLSTAPFQEQLSLPNTGLAFLENLYSDEAQAQCSSAYQSISDPLRLTLVDGPN